MQDFSKNTWELPDDADRTKNPVPTSQESVAKGKELYLERTKGNCIFCHGDTGSGNEANLPRLRRKPADISNKERMSSMTDGEVFWKISKGINGIMPDGEKRMSEEERWHVVNYVRTLAKKLQTSKPCGKAGRSLDGKGACRDAWLPCLTLKSNALHTLSTLVTMPRPSIGRFSADTL
jgi:mono/diheme cytochrome c family protein